MPPRVIPKALPGLCFFENKIFEQEFEVGELIPSESELEKIYNVSRTTIRKAIEMLHNEGLVYIQQGKGTEVLDCKITQNLNYVTSFSETMKEKGCDVSVKDITIDFVVPHEAVYKYLRIDPNSKRKLVRIYRVITSNNKPIAIMTNFLIPDLVKGIEKESRNIQSLYAILESKYNIKIDSAVEYIKATGASPDEAEILEIPTGSPLLFNKRITFSKTKPFEVVYLKICSSKYEYCAHMKDRPPKIPYIGE